MLPSYLIALVVAFIASCLSFNPREEIAILGTIISCTLVPLVIQLLILIFAWYGRRSICRSSNC